MTKKNKNLLIGAGVIGVLALIYFYNKKKTTTTKTDKNGGGGDSKSVDEPTGDPIPDSPSGEEKAVTKDTSTTKDIKPVEPVTTKDIKPQVLIKTRPMEMPKLAVEQPVATKELIAKTYTKEISPTKLTLSRFSGFQGGADFVDVGDMLTDL
jgi:hypothetical protein